MAYGTTLTLPAVTGSHTDTPLLLLCNGTRNDLPVDAYNSINAFANGGGDFTAYTDSGKGTQLAVHVVRFVSETASPDIEVRIATPAGNPLATGTTIYVEASATQTNQPAATATYGRENVYPNHTLAATLNSATPENSANTALSMTANNVTLTTGPNGRDALNFNGSSSYIDTGGLLLPTGDHTITALVNPDSVTGFQGIIGSWVSSDAARAYIGLNGSQGSYNTYGTTTGEDVITGVTVSIGTWVRITGTRIGSTNTLYVDTTNGGTVTHTNLPTTLYNTLIGAIVQGTQFFFDGQIVDAFCDSQGSSADRVAAVIDNESATTAWYSNSGWVDAGGTVDNLLADDLESASEVTSASIGQAHALSATSVQSLSELTTPSISVGGEENLLADDLQSLSTVSSVDVGQAHALLATGLDSSTEVDQGLISQTHVLTALSLVSLSELSIPDIDRSGPWEKQANTSTAWGKQADSVGSWSKNGNVSTTWT